MVGRPPSEVRFGAPVIAALAQGSATGRGSPQPLRPSCPPFAFRSVLPPGPVFCVVVSVLFLFVYFLAAEFFVIFRLTHFSVGKLPPRLFRPT